MLLHLHFKCVHPRIHTTDTNYALCLKYQSNDETNLLSKRFKDSFKADSVEVHESIKASTTAKDARNFVPEEKFLNLTLERSQHRRAISLNV